MSDDNITDDEAGSGNPELDDLLARSDAQSELEEDDVELDLSEAGSYDPFVGKFPAMVTKIEFTYAKGGSKGPMLKTEVTVIEGEHKGRKAWTNLMLKGKGAWKTKQAVVALGLDIDLDATPVRLGKVSRFLNIPVTVTFEISKQVGYKDKTEIAGFEVLEKADLSGLQ